MPALRSASRFLLETSACFVRDSREVRVMAWSGEERRIRRVLMSFMPMVAMLDGGSAIAEEV